MMKGIMANKAKPKWDIPSRGRHCFKGQEPLLPGMTYYSLLLVDEAGTYQRKDYCVSCWQEEFMGKEAPTTYWKATVAKRKDKKLNNQELGERALELLQATLNDPEAKEDAFVLGLYLHRIRTIAPRQEVQMDGVDCTLYEVLETGEMLCVPKESLSVAQISEAQSRLTAKLNED